MHAEAFSRATSINGRVHGARAAAVDVLAPGGPVEHALGARIALHHALPVIRRMLRECFDSHRVAAVHFEHGLEIVTEITPMNRVGRRAQQMMTRLAGLAGWWR